MPPNKTRADRNRGRHTGIQPKELKNTQIEDIYAIHPYIKYENSHNCRTCYSSINNSHPKLVYDCSNVEPHYKECRCGNEGSLGQRYV